MPTTVHVPPELLAAVDDKAKTLGISRNRLILRALERELRDTTHWSAGFVDQLRQVDPAIADAADDMLAAITKARRSKGPRDL